MNRLEQLFKKLGYSKDNGLFYHDTSHKWIHKFPYRTSRVLRDIIKPYAFYSLYHKERQVSADHPEPLNNPIILFFNNPDKEVEKNIPKWSFCFGRVPIVFINRDREGCLDIYHGYEFDRTEKNFLTKIDIEYDEFSLTNLTTGRTWKNLYDSYFKNRETVDKWLLKNIIDARRFLIAKNVGGLNPVIANRLIGRSLFIRYLIDRNVSFEDDSYIKGKNKKERQKSFNDLLNNKYKTYKFFKTITDKFNGDLFPLIENDRNGKIIYDEKKSVSKKHLDVLYYLFSCSSYFENGGSYGGYTVQLSLFNTYDFEVIPVELISNIYENFLGEPKENENSIDNLGTLKPDRKEIKAYYTPPFLVDYVLSETVTPYLEKQNKASCKVLDPACGSGIFLVETLRKLIEKEMRVNPVTGTDNRIIISEKRLWELVHENIFGIDIDNDAIEITIFSIYITLLDYKAPREIKSFRFEKLKDVNLFGGSDADFFNEDHLFNDLLKNEIHLDFIIGNPPWGKVKTSRYLEYIKNRDNEEKKENPDGHIKLDIKNDEISQAYIVRVTDFIPHDRKTRCVFIVTGKNLYNKSGPTESWRDYFLAKFKITQILELSGVNNKITGGVHVFESAKQPPVIISYYPADKGEDTSNNTIRHITVRANRFFHYFRTIVIEKHDVKEALQKYFIECPWLWKVFLHGNILDFHFIKRLKVNYKTFDQIKKKFNLESLRGLQVKFKSTKPGNKRSTDDLLDWNYLEIDKRIEFIPYSLNPTNRWKKKRDELIKNGSINGDGKIGRLPDIYFFTGKKLLIKRGLQAKNNYKAVSVFSEKKLLFTDSVISIKPAKGTRLTKEIEDILKTLVGLINSKLFTYFLLSTGASLGIDRARGDVEEFLLFPVILSREVSHKVVEIQNLYNELNRLQLFDPKKEILKGKIEKDIEKIEQTIYRAYKISDQEKALIDYAIDVSIPVLKRAENDKEKTTDAFDRLSLTDQSDKDYLSQYAEVFVEHFGNKFNSSDGYFTVDVHVTNQFIGVHFKITKKAASAKRINFKPENDEVDMINKIGSLGFYSLSRDLYVRQDVRGFNNNSFYVIKPNERKSWHKAVAYLDRAEFIDAIVKAEIKMEKRSG